MIDLTQDGGEQQPSAGASRRRGRCVVTTRTLGTGRGDRCEGRRQRVNILSRFLRVERRQWEARGCLADRGFHWRCGGRLSRV